MNLQDLISKRDSIWKKYDESQKESQKIQGYASRFGLSGREENIAALIPTGTPPEKVAAAIWQIRQEEEKIKNAEADIQRFQEEIMATKQQFFVVAGVASVVVIILLIIVFNAIF